MEGMPLMMVLSIGCDVGEEKPNITLIRCLAALVQCITENHAHYVGLPELVGDRVHVDVDFDSDDSVIRFYDLIPGIPLGTIEVLFKDLGLRALQPLTLKSRPHI